MSLVTMCLSCNVHGDIRHLEIVELFHLIQLRVHGDIRHLEIVCKLDSYTGSVHGDIRHLEMAQTGLLFFFGGYVKRIEDK